MFSLYLLNVGSMYEFIGWRMLFEANIVWVKREGDTFTGNNFSRAHHWYFEGGEVVPATASHHIVPIPYSEPKNVDPEQAYIAALSSCHMMSFLTIASKRNYVVERYADQASGCLEQGETGKFSITEVTLRPDIRFSGSRIPSAAELKKMHNVAHQNCFIANSVNTRINIEI